MAVIRVHNLSDSLTLRKKLNLNRPRSITVEGSTIYPGKSIILDEASLKDKRLVRNLEHGYLFVGERPPDWYRLEKKNRRLRK